VALVTTALTANRVGTVNVRLRCPTGQRHCSGTLTIRTLHRVVVVGQTGKKGAILTLASGSFELVGGRERTLMLHLSATARRLLIHVRVVRARATLVTKLPGGSARSQTIVTVR
jgi:hypothetical protein